MLSSSPERLFSFGLACLMMAGVAALAGEAVKTTSINPVPRDDRQRLIDLYGKWAVNAAAGCCPHGDAACVEREAKRLWEARVLRR